ncbi:hypothetical protein EXE58_03540 [Nocardioides seonyuensis]|uniref:Aminoglycoside phosphotransferase domain-containing protein n=1 Tax=Nocardioides seonyuensis TaxID=2518371 RepID=A0A4V1BLZ9_9ACTN|nr:phosphotransferase [Nocardioides seonyuensis]QBX54632.1 hypothetical protein EXE58_03540 [Nocardioides seonyuensis]
MKGVDADAARALMEFGFTGAEAASLEQLPRGIKNLNYKVRASGQDWVLKCHQAAGAAERLASSHRMELALGQAGFPVAPLRRLESGRTIVETPTGVFTLHAWVEGRQISIDQREQALSDKPALVEELGGLLGELHREAAGSLGHGSGNGQADVLARLAAPSEIAARVRRGGTLGTSKTLKMRLRGPRNEFERWILEVLPDLFRRADRLASPEVASQVDGGDVVVAHNDLNWENVVLSPSLDVLAVLDFDNASVLPRALDVGAAAVVLVGVEPSRVERFSSAYAQASGVSVERSALALGMQWKCVRSILWTIDAYASGKVGRSELAATWCGHLYDSAQTLPLWGGPLKCEEA